MYAHNLLLLVGRGAVFCTLMPLHGGNKGILSEKQRILRLSAEEAPVDVPPEVEVALRNGGVEPSKDVESFVEAPSEGAGSS